MSNELLRKLEERLGPLHARQRLGIEKDHEAQVFGQGLIFFHLENWYSAPAIIQMVPAMEDMGIGILLNECEAIVRGDQRIYLTGIDDAHFYRVDNIEKAALQIPEGAFSMLLSHTPEVYRQAAHANFNLMLSGHTHGGQICLPGSIPIKLEAVLPRRMGADAWRYQNMTGYPSVGAGTSVLPVRLNCPPEITLHCLRCA